MLTSLPSSAFHYDTTVRTEVEKGATSAAFCFHVVYCDEFARLCTLTVDEKKTKLDCIRHYISPLRRVQEVLLQCGCLSHSVKLKPADSCDTHTMRASTLQVMYLAHVLLGWFERARAVLVARIESHNLNSIMSVTPFVSEGRRAQTAWDWRSHAPGSAPVPTRMQLLMDWVDGTPRPVFNVVDPGNWAGHSTVMLGRLRRVLPVARTQMWGALVLRTALTTTTPVGLRRLIPIRHSQMMQREQRKGRLHHPFPKTRPPRPRIGLLSQILTSSMCFSRNCR